MLANRLVPKLFASKLAPTKSGGRRLGDIR